jgi:hypothetical protein
MVEYSHILWVFLKFRFSDRRKSLRNTLIDKTKTGISDNYIIEKLRHNHSRIYLNDQPVVLL